MKITIHSTTFNGKPLETDSEKLEGRNALELVQIMASQTPFTADGTTEDYMAGVLAQIGEEVKPCTPEEFLSILARRRLIEFLPDDAYIEPVERRENECADKQV
ncbi:MAG: hypothetical protein ACIAQZ_11810 [Sedimentisphaeraceae bacterium JB056]